MIRSFPMNNMENRFTLQFEVQQEMLLREAIALWGISKRTLTAIKFDGGEILVNGVERNVRHVVVARDIVTIIFPLEEASDGLAPQYGELTIVYEDEAFLVIDKPAYMSTIPSREHPDGSVANFVLGYFQQKGLPSTVHIVTRLDRDTSGLLCIAKNRHIHYLMSVAQQQGNVHRQYEAIVSGEAISQSIVEPIGRKETSIIEREVRQDGQFAHTDVEVIKYGRLNGCNVSHIRLTLHTGRTHQIRVHMAYVGHPLVGDGLYGGDQQVINRQVLHCVSLTFQHPLTKEVLSFRSELPQELSNLLK
ncbi:RluA family pseudouridine synthase [Metasolibacillus meyeri]|uniref:Pseudouridine synthase n=2 Tax=Metasolibacillus meyeri TaxID=1071052 RepID=A0AAW9NJF3_9BACL|nr:RluA family pseudouridine synthase [Metasolibacillus meyeri]